MYPDGHLLYECRVIATKIKNLDIKMLLYESYLPCEESILSFILRPVCYSTASLLAVWSSQVSARRRFVSPTEYYQFIKAIINYPL